MEHEAIKELLAIGAQRAGAFSEALNTVGDDLVALPKDYSLIDLERYRDGRRRFRGAFTTSALADFVAYVKRNSAKVKPQGFISPDDPAATVYFNLYNDDGAVGHADWTAALALDKTAAYAALLHIQGRALTQRQLTDWIEDWQANVVALAGDDTPITLPRAVAAISKLDIKSTKQSGHADGHFAASKSTLEEVEAKLTESMPHKLLFECEPFHGLRARTFELRVAILTNHDEPRLTLRILSLEAVQEDITREFKALLLQELDGAADLSIGTFKP